MLPRVWSESVLVPPRLYIYFHRRECKLRTGGARFYRDTAAMSRVPPIIVITVSHMLEI